MARSITAGTMGVVILAILAGLVGAYAFRTMVLDKKVAAAPAPTTTPVPHASTELPEGRTISMGDILLKPMTLKQIQDQWPETWQQVLINPDQIIGRVVKKALQTGQPFESTNLYLEGERPDIASMLPPDTRAYSVMVSNREAQFLKNSDLVDVLFRSEPRRAQDDQLAIPEATVTLLEGVQVVLVDRPRQLAPVASTQSNLLDLRGTPNMSLPPATVTLAVSLDQANVLQTVEGRGQISLVPRAADDGGMPTAVRRNRKLTLEELLGIEPPPEPEPPAPPQPVVVFATEIYRRGQRDINMFRERGTQPADPKLRALPTYDPSAGPGDEPAGADDPAAPPAQPPAGAQPGGDPFDQPKSDGN